MRGEEAKKTERNSVRERPRERESERESWKSVRERETYGRRRRRKKSVD